VTRPSLSAVAQTLGFTLVVAAVLFGTAGRLDIPLFWLYLAVIASLSAAALFLIDEDLARERMWPGGRPPGLRLILVSLFCIMHWAIAGLDPGRFHWSDTVPRALRIIGIIVFAGGLSIFIWAMHVNRFFSSVIRIQRERGHHLVTGGPYRWVRHPGYAAALPAIVASGLALGSFGNRDRHPRRAAAVVANDCRGPCASRRAAGLQGLLAAGPLAVAPGNLVTGHYSAVLCTAAGPVGRNRVMTCPGPFARAR
jgi:protein-S-isoprenylcysteine O-methyltransferase Ste14